MKKTYKKEITNKYYAIHYWNALVNNNAVKSAVMGKTPNGTWLIEWWYN